MQQLSLFQPTEPEWNNITLDWLQEYITNYSDLKFIQKDNGIECCLKKVVLRFSISIVDLKEYTCWTNPLLVHFDLHKNGGDYQGLGFAVDNMNNFRKNLIDIIEKFKIWVG